MIAEKLIYQGLILCLHENPCKGAGVTPKCRYGQQLPMGDYRYHELRPLISNFPCHWVVPVYFPNTCPMNFIMKIVRVFQRIIARYGRDIYTLTQSFPNQKWYNKSTYDLVERLLFPSSFYRRYIKFNERYSDVSKFRMIFILLDLSHFSWHRFMCLIFEHYLTLFPPNKIQYFCHFSHLKRILVGAGIPEILS